MKSIQTGKILLWVAAATLSVFLLISLAVAFQNIYWYAFPDTTYDDTYYEYIIEEGYYVSLINLLEHDHRSEEDMTDQYEEFSAIGDYYKAASLYKAYLAVNDTDSAAIQKQIMERNAEILNEYDEQIDIINELLDLN